MGKKDFRHRETKKPKKDTKKTLLTTVLPPPLEVEVIKKGKKERKEGEE